MCVSACVERASTYKWFRLNGNCFDIIDQFFTLAFPFLFFLVRMFFLAAIPKAYCKRRGLVIRIAHSADFLCENFGLFFRITFIKYMCYMLPSRDSCRHFSWKPIHSKNYVDSIKTDITTTKSGTMNWYYIFIFSLQFLFDFSGHDVQTDVAWNQ